VRQAPIEQADEDFPLHVPQYLELVLHFGQLQERFPLSGFGLFPPLIQAEDRPRIYSVHAAFASSEILYAVTRSPNRSSPHGVKACFFTRARSVSWLTCVPSTM
jgi:hypothetical protein